MIVAITNLRKLPQHCGSCRLADYTTTADRYCTIIRRPCPMEPGQAGKPRYIIREKLEVIEHDN